MLGAGLVQLIQVGLESTCCSSWFVVVGNVGWTWLYAPFIVLGMACFAQGVGLVLATANARFGDVQYIVAVVLGRALLPHAGALPAPARSPAAAAGCGHLVDRPSGVAVRRSLHDALYTLDGPGPLATSGLLALRCSSS